MDAARKRTLTQLAAKVWNPPMAAAVAAAVSRGRQDLSNTVINAGVSGGVALSGPIALAIAGQWRLAFGAFAVAALALAIAAAVSRPAASGGARAGGLPPMTGPVLRLISASFMMGAASTALWSFGGQLVSNQMVGGRPEAPFSGRASTPVAWPAPGPER